MSADVSKIIEPSSVNLMALDNRLFNTCAILNGSPVKKTDAGILFFTRNRIFFSLACV